MLGRDRLKKHRVSGDIGQKKKAGVGMKSRRGGCHWSFSGV
jgi:hypothetical protein